MEKELDVPGIKVIEPVNDHFEAEIDYQNYRLLKKTFRYDDNVAHELYKMAKKIAVYLKDRTFSGKELISVIAFLLEFKLACDACKMHESKAMWLLKK